MHAEDLQIKRPTPSYEISQVPIQTIQDSKQFGTESKEYAHDSLQTRLDIKEVTNPMEPPFCGEPNCKFDLMLTLTLLITSNAFDDIEMTTCLPQRSRP